MTTKETIKGLFDFNHFVMTGYVGDFSDEDLLVRPVPGANHTAWQLGHLISSERSMIGAVGASAPELPAGFAEQHGKDKAASDAGFAKKAEYLELYNTVRAATLEALAKIDEKEFDKPNPHEMSKKIAPTIGSLFMLAANHEMMHAGQVAVARRKLGKPVLF